MIDQYSDTIKYFNYAIMIFATYNCLYLPLEIAFQLEVRYLLFFIFTRLNCNLSSFERVPVE